MNPCKERKRGLATAWPRQEARLCHLLAAVAADARGGSAAAGTVPAVPKIECAPPIDRTSLRYE